MDSDQDTSFEFVIDSAIGEHKISGEDEILRDLVQIFSNHFQTKYAGEPGTARRAVHAKSHGCLKAKFKVLDHQDRDLAHAIFGKPASYDAVIRFSNGDGPAGPDSDKRVSVGIGIKVFGVTTAKLLDTQVEETIDFLLINQPMFLVPDVRGFKTVIEAREDGRFKGVSAFFRHPVGILKRLSAFPKGDPLDIVYWSVLPFQLGDTTVKYLLRPEGPASGARVDPMT